jgi:hypothetical protein
MTVKTKTEDLDRLELDRDDATVTSAKPGADARKVYASYLRASQDRTANSVAEARILGAPAVKQAFADSRASLDAWKKTL